MQQLLHKFDPFPSIHPFPFIDFVTKPSGYFNKRTFFTGSILDTDLTARIKNEPDTNTPYKYIFEFVIKLRIKESIKKWMIHYRAFFFKSDKKILQFTIILFKFFQLFFDGLGLTQQPLHFRSWNDWEVLGIKSNGENIFISLPQIRYL